MKSLKKLMTAMIAIVITLSMAACNSNSPKSVVKKALDNIKSGNAADISDLMNGDTESKDSDTESDDAYPNSTEKMKESLKKIDYKINSETVNGDTATVNVGINGPDLAAVMGDFMKQAMADTFSEAFSGSTMTEEETDAKYDKMLCDLLDNMKFEDRTMDINLVKENNEWTIKDSDEIVKLVLNIDPSAFNSEDSANSETSNTTSKVQDMTLNQPLLVETADGNYNITIEGVRKTDERNEFSDKEAKTVIFLDYTYENISYGEKNNQDLYISEYDFQVLDDEGNVLDTYPVSDDNRTSKETPVGGKCKSTGAFAINTDSKNINVTFKNSFEKVGKIIIPIQ